jgi:hypothetical protein
MWVSRTLEIAMEELDALRILTSNSCHCRILAIKRAKIFKVGAGFLIFARCAHGRPEA